MHNKIGHVTTVLPCRALQQLSAAKRKMSGKRQKAGPYRPHQRVTETKSEPAADAMPTGETAPPLTAAPLMEGRLPNILVLVSSIVIGIMFIIAFGFCVAGGVRHKQPRYFLLLINLILSTSVTGLLIFWYYRRILRATLLWYVFLQCIILFFQCVTTDIFAWYEIPAAEHKTQMVPWSTLANSSSNHTNTSSMTLTQWSI